MKKSTLIFIALSLLFFGFGMMTLQDAMPSKKEERIYTAISKHFPYTIEKRLGGLTITFKDTDEKMKPTNSEFFSKIESIDRFWAKENLILKADKVMILDKSKIIIDEIKFEKPQEKEFIKTYFDIKEIL